MPSFCAVLVTRGEVDISRIVESFQAVPEIKDFIVWDNSRNGDVAVLGRYLASCMSPYEAIYTQDDDCLVDVPAVVAEYEPDKVTVNMPEDKRREYRAITGTERIALMGWGSCFPRLFALSQPPLWSRYFRMFGNDELFKRECDRIFTAAYTLKMIDVGFVNLEHASGPNRMSSNAQQHLSDLVTMATRIRVLEGSKE